MFLPQRLEYRFAIGNASVERCAGLPCLTQLVIELGFALRCLFTRGEPFLDRVRRGLLLETRSFRRVGNRSLSLDKLERECLTCRLEVRQLRQQLRLAE